MIDLRILDAHSQREQLWPLSVEAYRKLGEARLIPEKTELLQGLIFRKHKTTPFHRAILQRLIDRLNAVLRRDAFWLQSEQPISCGDSEPEPDVSVVRGSNEDFLDRHPDTAELAIEIAINSREMDRAKAAIYAAAGVKEYWMVDVNAQAIHIQSGPMELGYQKRMTVTEDETAESTVVPEFRVRVAALLARQRS